MAAFFQAHSLILLLILAAVVTAWWLWRQRERLSLRLPWILLLSVLHVTAGVLCVKGFAILEAGSFSAAGNMSLFGAVFFLPLFYWLGAKLTHRSVSETFDVFVVPTVFTLACARVNCLLTGCCQGRIIPGSELRWPTREAELVFYAVLLPWLVWRTARKDRRGILWPAYMAAYGAFRFFTEFFREPATSFFHLSHLWAALSLITGLSICLQILSKSKTHKSKTKLHRRKTR